ncbi:MAG TPA: hypothetical protein PK887_07770 [Ignavibacteriales bacterium]|nr:hypothetical protein [Ignavibacteriales bacterium]
MKNLLLSIFIFLSNIIFAQNIDEIKKSNNYYWGEAIADNQKEAEDLALGRLLNQISVTVSQSYQKIIEENEKNLKETVKNILNTYSVGSFKNLKNIVTPKNDKIEVFYYIYKNEVNEIFIQRKKLVYDIYQAGNEFVKQLNLSAALKNYYFCLILLNSIPEQNIIYDDINFTTEIPKAINNILSNIKFIVVSDTLISPLERQITVRAEYQGKAINNLDFSFWNGSSQTNIEIKDGDAIFYLVSSSVYFEKLDISIKYNYYEARNEIQTVGDLWNLVPKPSFKNSYILPLKLYKNDNSASNVSTQTSNQTTSSNEIDNITTSTSQRKINIINNDKCNVVDKISKNTQEFISFLEKCNLKEMPTFIFNDNYLKNKVANLLKYNNLKLPAGDINAKLNKTSDGWELRKLTVTNYYPSLKKQTKEYLIFDYDRQGNLVDINLGINNSQYDKFIQEQVPDKDRINKQIIIKFAEKYRTYFHTRDINMIDSIFADEAIIIIGRVYHKIKNKDMYQYFPMNSTQPDIRYIQYSKNQYLKNLSSLFKREKDIYIGYTTLNITRKNKQENVYGLSLRQNYHSSSYSDEGYLFLLVDFDKDIPTIYVRSWQPQEWNKEALIKLSNFNINK